MDERISIPVSLPHPNPTVSYWQNPPDEIGDICSTTQLPEEVDIAIVGSGISGAAIAYNVLCRAPGTNIVMLEARNAVSGATGRNGTHSFVVQAIYEITFERQHHPFIFPPGQKCVTSKVTCT